MKALKIVLIGFTLVLFIRASAFAQSNLFTGIEIHPAAIADAKVSQALNNTFRNYHIFNIDAQAVHRYVNNSGDNIDLHLRLNDDYDWNLHLNPSGLLDDDYQMTVATENGLVIYPKPEDFTYKGYNRDAANPVRISIREDAIAGTVRQEGSTLFIEAVQEFVSGAPAGWFVVYDEKDILDNKGLCGNSETGEAVIPGTNATPAAVKKTEIALAADNSFVVNRGSIAAAQTRMIDALNALQVWYCNNNLDITYVLTETFISSCSTCDPAAWTTTVEAGTLLNNFLSWGNAGGFAKPFDVASLWTKRNLEVNGAAGVVGLAKVAGICTSSKYNILEHYSSALQSVAIAQAHELGHNWSAKHTTPADNTMIMNATINSNNTKWDSAAVSSILAYKNNASCLSSGTAACGVTTGLPDDAFLIQNGIAVFPNPCTNKINLQGELGKTTVVSIELINFMGLRIISENTSNVSGNFRKEINMSGLASGMYLLLVQAGDKKWIEKIIKE